MSSNLNHIEAISHILEDLIRVHSRHRLQKRLLGRVLGLLLANRVWDAELTATSVNRV